MDQATRAALKAISDAHDTMAVQVAALVAIVGAITEKHPIDVSRVDAWCRAIAQHSDKERGVGQTAVQRMAYDLLRGIGAHSKG